ncbi:MAG: branched-chain amino acid transport system II carrier protein [Firmicutes bacterium]|nr:branched-chain amino acid transport system II carrier protein [Candidatus Colivicinus equi]
MKKWLTFKESVLIMSMLFGMFFGAGNLILPVYMGQLAGKNVVYAVIGFLITGVSLPLLAVAALGKSRSQSLYDLSSRVSKNYGKFFTTALYLTIGPCFAIPRCATTSYAVGVAPMLDADNNLYLFVFSFLFFVAAAYFSLRSDKILTYIGKILNPIFLCFLAIILFKAFTNPMASFSTIEASESYINNSLFNGFYEGYNTMDALAGLAFGIVVVNVVRSHGLVDGDAVAANTIVAGITSCLLMGVIYVALAFAGANSPTTIGICANGGEALSKIATYYFGDVGTIFLACIVTFACLKTAVGLIISCSEAFYELQNHKIDKKVLAIVFLAISFTIANLGLNQIINFSIPVLMFLYPLAIVLILLALSSNAFKKTPFVYRTTIYAALPFALLELIKSLPFDIKIVKVVNNLVNALPLGNIGLEWLLPSFVVFVISLIYAKTFYKKK